MAGTIPFRMRDGKLEILLVTSRRKPKRLTLPGGRCQAGESPKEAALRETSEEAGVTGQLRRSSLPLYIEVKRGKIRQKRLLFFMRVDKELPRWPEENDRRRVWHDLATLESGLLTKQTTRILRKGLKHPVMVRLQKKLDNPAIIKMAS
jgi:8-oxo-dGTP pyrophosphatase MutT (NUDIX family)